MKPEKNPYTKLYGCTSNNDIPIVGYGITLETIRSFLFDHRLSTDLIVKNSENPDEEPSDKDLTDATYAHQNVVSYTSFSNLSDECLMTFAQSLKSDQPLPTKSKVVNAIFVAVHDLFKIPRNQNDKINVELLDYIQKYTDDISISDYS
jgi:hypothetical protein